MKFKVTIMPYSVNELIVDGYHLSLADGYAMLQFGEGVKTRWQLVRLAGLEKFEIEPIEEGH